MSSEREHQVCDFHENRPYILNGLMSVKRHVYDWRAKLQHDHGTDFAEGMEGCPFQIVMQIEGVDR